MVKHQGFYKMSETRMALEKKILEHLTLNQVNAYGYLAAVKSVTCDGLLEIDGNVVKDE